MVLLSLEKVCLAEMIFHAGLNHLISRSLLFSVWEVSADFLFLHSSLPQGLVDGVWRYAQGGGFSGFICWLCFLDRLLFFVPEHNFALTNFDRYNISLSDKNKHEMSYSNNRRIALNSGSCRRLCVDSVFGSSACIPDRFHAKLNNSKPDRYKVKTEYDKCTLFGKMKYYSLL